MLRLLPVALITLAACQSEPSDVVDAAGADEIADDAVAASATMLVSGDFLNTSTTKGIVQTELANNPAARLIAVGDMSYTAPYTANYPWAQWAAKTYPVMGNHEFNSIAGAGGKQPFDLFNGNNAANDHTFPALMSGKLATFDFTYSYEIAPNWLLVVLNSGTDCTQQSCDAQAMKLTAWIDTWRNNHNHHGCVIVALHTARFSTQFSGSTDNLPWATSVKKIWEAAVAAKADIVLQGHVHVYEEFHKLDANGNTSATGTKLFTVGAGGRGQEKPNMSNIPATELIASHDSPINGVLKLALYPGSYGYKFETAASSGNPASSIACNMP
jgi:hypothetical protein